MILTTRCNKCNQEIEKWTWFADRVELAKSEGEFLEQTCKKCGAKTKYHVDSFQAVPSKLARIIASAVFLLGTPIVLFIIWDILWVLTWSYVILALAGLFLIPVTVYRIMLNDDRRKVNSFNRHKLKGHRY